MIWNISELEICNIDRIEDNWYKTHMQEPEEIYHCQNRHSNQQSIE